MSAIQYGDFTVTGNLYVNGAVPTIYRSQLPVETGSAFEILPQELRVWNAFQTPLGTAGTDDLGITAGAFGTGTPYITAGDCGSAGTTTRYARFLVQLPMNYDAGQAASFAFLAGITGTVPNVAATSCTLDCEAYKVGVDTLVTGSDLISTAAQSINFTAFASYSFNLTVTSANPGDWLDVRITIVCVDGASTAANVVPAIQKLQLIASTQG